jgi:enoyl-CoA hydratase/carnithine racemase
MAAAMAAVFLARWANICMAKPPSRLSVICRRHGRHSCFQELLGVKRAAYALLTGQTIDAKTALEYGVEQATSRR